MADAEEAGEDALTPPPQDDRSARPHEENKARIESCIDSVIKQNTSAAELMDVRGAEEIVVEVDEKSRNLGEEVKRLREQGLTFAQIALELQQPLSTCYTAMKNLKLPKEYANSLKDAVRKRKSLGIMPVVIVGGTSVGSSGFSESIQNDCLSLNSNERIEHADGSVECTSNFFLRDFVKDEKGDSGAGASPSNVSTSGSGLYLDPNGDLSSTALHLLQMVNSSLMQKDTVAGKAAGEEDPDYMPSDSDASASMESEPVTRSSPQSPLVASVAPDKLLMNIRAFINVNSAIGGPRFSCKLCAKTLPSPDTHSVSKHVRVHHPISYRAGVPVTDDWNVRPSKAKMTERDSDGSAVAEKDSSTLCLSDIVGVTFKRRGERTSAAWMYVVPGSGGRHRCTVCQTEIESVGVSNIARHMRAHHPGLLQEAEVIVSEGGPSSKRTRVDKDAATSLFTPSTQSLAGGKAAGEVQSTQAKAASTFNGTTVVCASDGALTSATATVDCVAPVAGVPVVRVPMMGERSSAQGSASLEVQNAIEGIRNKLLWTSNQLAAATDPDQIVALMNVISNGLNILKTFGYI